MTQATSCIGRLLRRIELRRGTKGSNCPWTTSILRASFVEKSSNKKLFMIIVGLRHLWHAFVVVFKPLILETLILGAIIYLLLHEKL